MLYLYVQPISLSYLLTHIIRLLTCPHDCKADNHSTALYYCSCQNTLIFVSPISSKRNGTAKSIISANLHMAPTSSDPSNNAAENSNLLYERDLTLSNLFISNMEK
uniref:Uncharacterized protein n=1 Tax=Zea mays TaxID=4577 RepID=A0A804UHF4_MAIZE